MVGVALIAIVDLAAVAIIGAGLDITILPYQPLKSHVRNRTTPAPVFFLYHHSLHIQRSLSPIRALSRFVSEVILKKLSVAHAITEIAIITSRVMSMFLLLYANTLYLYIYQNTQQTNIQNTHLHLHTHINIIN